MYIYCVVCYHVIAALYVRCIGHIFAYLYTIDDDSELSMVYETSFLSKVLPPHAILAKKGMRTSTTLW